MLKLQGKTSVHSDRDNLEVKVLMRLCGHRCGLVFDGTTSINTICIFVANLLSGTKTSFDIDFRIVWIVTFWNHCTPRVESYETWNETWRFKQGMWLWALVVQAYINFGWGSQFRPWGNMTEPGATFSPSGYRLARVIWIHYISKVHCCCFSINATRGVSSNKII